MIWDSLPLAGLLLFLVVGFGWRSWWHARRFGGSGYRLFRSGRVEQNVRETLLLLLGVLLVGQAVAATMSPSSIGMLRVAPTMGRPLEWGGAILLFGSTALLIKAQLDLGASWRIGVTDDERPGLVTSGIYKWSRNPIYVAVFLMLTGYALLLPTWLSLAMLAGGMVGFASQARAEEKHLLRLYGDEYRLYARHAGRFLPYVGELE